MASKKLSKATKQELNAVAQKTAQSVANEYKAHQATAPQLVADKVARKARKRANKKVGKKALKGAASNYLALLNPYALTIMDPFRFRGVKIPDLVTIPSATVSTVKRWQLSTVQPNVLFSFGASVTNTVVPANAVSDTNLRRIGLVPLPNSAFPKLSQAVGVIYSSSVPGFGGSATTTVEQILYLDEAFGNPLLSPSGIPTIASNARLVSAGLAVQYTGTAIAASGVFTTVSCPVDSLRDKSFGTGFATNSFVRSLPNATTSAVNNLNGVCMRYLPLSAARSDYVDLSLDTGSVSNPVNLDDNFDVRCHNQWAFVCQVDGLNTSITNSFEITLVCNYEILPNTNSLSWMETSPSYADPISHAQASNIAQSLPSSVPSARMALETPTGGVPMGTPMLTNNGQYLETGMNIHQQPAAMHTPEQILGQVQNGVTMTDRLLTQGSGIVDQVSQLADKFGPLVEEGLMLF